MSTPQDAAQPANEVRTYRTCQRCHVTHWHESACPQCGKKNPPTAQPDDATKLDVQRENDAQRAARLEALEENRAMVEKIPQWKKDTHQDLCGSRVPAPKRSGRIKVRSHDKGPAKPTPCMDEPDLDDVPALNPADALESLIRDTHGPLTAKDRALVDEVRAYCDTAAPAPLSDDPAEAREQASQMEAARLEDTPLSDKEIEDLKRWPWFMPDGAKAYRIWFTLRHWKQRAEEAETPDWVCFDCGSYGPFRQVNYVAGDCDCACGKCNSANTGEVSEYVTLLQDQVADAIDRLGGSPDSKLDGDDGLAAQFIEAFGEDFPVSQKARRALAQLREENERQKRVISGQDDVIRSFQDGYHAISEALGVKHPGDTNDEDIVKRIDALRARVAQLEEEKAGVVSAFNPAGLEIDMPEALGGEKLMDALCALAAQEKESQ